MKIYNFEYFSLFIYKNFGNINTCKSHLPQFLAALTMFSLSLKYIWTIVLFMNVQTKPQILWQTASMYWLEPLQIIEALGKKFSQMVSFEFNGMRERSSVVWRLALIILIFMKLFCIVYMMENRFCILENLCSNYI